MGTAVSAVGPSISLAATAEALTFAIGIAIPVPAVRSFSICACLAIILDYLLQVTSHHQTFHYVNPLGGFQFYRADLLFDAGDRSADYFFTSVLESEMIRVYQRTCFSHLTTRLFSCSY